MSSLDKLKFLNGNTEARSETGTVLTSDEEVSCCLVFAFPEMSF